MAIYEMNLSEYNLSMKAIAVFKILFDRKNKNTHECFPSLKCIAKDLGASVSTVKRAINELCEVGLIKKTHRFRENGGQSSNLYKIILEVKERTIAAKENAKVKLHDLKKRIEAKKNKEINSNQVAFDLEQFENKNENMMIGKITAIKEKFEAIFSPVINFNRYGR